MTAPSRPPFEWANDISRTFLGRDYLAPGKTVETRVGDIAATAARWLKKPEIAQKIYDYTSYGWFSFSSPVWSNFGLTRGLPISCFGTYVSDSYEGLLDAQYEVGMMSKYGGGTSLCMTPVRGRGAVITDNGFSAGSVHHALRYDTEIRITSQGSSRRGECAVYWDIEHPDVREALEIHTERSEIKKLQYGFCISDRWMRGLLAGDKDKRELWALIAKRRREKGLPYLVFIDNANAQAPAEYTELGLKIHQSNLCVTGDQRVVSDRGLRTARELYEEGGALTLFDNETPVAASPMRLIERDADVYRITLDNGMTHTVTGYHKVLVRTSPSGYPVRTEMRACDDLQLGDLVAVQTEKGLFGATDRPQEAFLLGLYHGDGTQTDRIVCLDVWENDFDLLAEIEDTVAVVCDRHGLQQNVRTGRVYTAPKFMECSVNQSTVRKRRLATAGLKKFGFAKGVIPEWVWAGTEETQWQYVRGLLYTDGTVHVGRSAGNPLQISLASADREFLARVQLIFANLGIQSTIRVARRAGKTMLPDGRGGRKEYDCQACWRLCVGSKNDALVIEERTGFLSRKGVAVENREHRDNTKKFFKVVSVEHVGKEDVYCCTVDTDSHLWVCNGVVTSNCTEIFLSNSPLESFVCCLSSLNMLRYDEWKDTDAVEVMVYLLDAVMTEFIEKATGVRGFGRAVRFAQNQRALGMGQIGWHSYLQSRMVPYDSPVANGIAVQCSKAIKDQAFAASAKMAAEYGEPLYLKHKGRRHMTLTAIAPNQSSAAIMGQISEGIEMMAANIAVKDKQKVKYVYQNPFLMALLAERKLDTADVVDSITRQQGSVQHLDGLTAAEKAVFRTARETHPMAVVRQAAARQPYVCQGQSLNLTVDPAMDLKEYNQVLIEAWRLGLKSLYYQHNVSAAQDVVKNFSCTACEG